MAQFTKGKSGNITGKPRGVKSKKTLLIESFAKTIVEGGMEKFQTELNKLRGEEYIHAYLTLLEYVKPKLQRTDMMVGKKPKAGYDLWKDLQDEEYV